MIQSYLSKNDLILYLFYQLFYSYLYLLFIFKEG